MATINIETLEIKQDTKSERFFFSSKGHEDAYVNYQLHTDTEPHTIEFTETYVPSEIRNIGIATRMASEAIQFALDQNYQIKPTCSFIRDYLDTRKDAQHLIVE